MKKTKLKIIEMPAKKKLVKSNSVEKRLAELERRIERLESRGMIFGAIK